MELYLFILPSNVCIYSTSACVILLIAFLAEQYLCCSAYSAIMTFSPVALWKRDTALHTYIFIAFIIGLPFTLLATYVVYQIQVLGFLLGTDSDGLPCVSYCLVPFGSKTLDLNSVILYLNAMGLGIGGFLSLIISAYADYFSRSIC